jgi:hypothetical protein
MDDLPEADFETTSRLAGPKTTDAIQRISPASLLTQTSTFDPPFEGLYRSDTGKCVSPRILMRKPV